MSLTTAKKLFWLTSGNSIDYYVAQGASGVGTIADPMSFADAITAVQANQTIALKAGDTFDIDEATIPFDGVTITSYGSGAHPIIRGSYDIGANSWTLSGDFYYTTLAAEPKWVYKNGRELRQGQSAWISITATPAVNQRTASTAVLNPFNTVQSLIGAKIRYEEFDFRLSYETTITGYNSGTGVITTADNFVGAAVGNRFFLYGHQQYSTVADDWWWDSANLRLYIRATSTPAGSDIRVCDQDYGLVIATNNVTVKNVDFTQFYKGSLIGTGNNLTIDNVDIYNIRWNGMYFEEAITGLSVTNFTLEQIGGNGIWFRGAQGATFSNFTISYVGLEKNYPWPIVTGGGDVLVKSGGVGIVGGDDQSNSAGQKVPNNIIIKYGSCDNFGYSVIAQYGQNWLVEYLVGDAFCKRWTDGGGYTSFHIAGLDASLTYSGDTILNNVMMLNGGTGNIAWSPKNIAGFYNDLNSKNFTYNNCVSYNNYGSGFYLNGECQAISFNYCLSFGNRVNEWMFYYYNSTQGLLGNDGYAMQMNNCTAVAVNQSGRCIALAGYGATDPFDSGGSINNNHYVNAYEASTIAVVRTGYYGTVTTTYDLAGWRTKTGGDGSSTARLNYFTNWGDVLAIYKDHQIIVNSTNAAVAYDYTGFDDVEGNPITTGSLPAYSAMVIVRDTQTQNYLFLDSFTAANGTVIAGRAPIVGSAPTSVTATGAWIQSNKMVDNGVNGAVTWDIGSQYSEVFLQMNGSSDAGENLALSLFYLDANNRVLFLTTDGINFTLRDYPNSATPTITALSYYEDLAGNGAARTNDFIFKFTRSGNNLSVYAMNRTVGKRNFEFLGTVAITNEANNDLLVSLLTAGTDKAYDFIAIE